jgi:hypothetical protein
MPSPDQEPDQADDATASRPTITIAGSAARCLNMARRGLTCSDDFRAAQVDETLGGTGTSQGRVGPASRARWCRTRELHCHLNFSFLDDASHPEESARYRMTRQTSESDGPRVALMTTSVVRYLHARYGLPDPTY